MPCQLMGFQRVSARITVAAECPKSSLHPVLPESGHGAIINSLLGFFFCLLRGRPALGIAVAAAVFGFVVQVGDGGDGLAARAGSGQHLALVPTMSRLEPFQSVIGIAQLRIEVVELEFLTLDCIFPARTKSQSIFGP